MIVVRIEIGGEARSYTSEHTFTVGNLPGCSVVLPQPTVQGYSIAIFVLADQALVGEGSRKVPMTLDGVDVDLGVRHALRAGSVIVVYGATITVEQVPHGQSTFDHAAAREFDRDVQEQIAAEPPPRPQISSLALSMDSVARVRDADPAALVARQPDHLGDLESVLGLALPADLYVHGGIWTREGRPNEHPVRSFGAHVVYGTLQPPSGAIEDMRHRWLDRYDVHWSRGRARCEAALAQRFGEPVLASDGGSQVRVYGHFVVAPRDGDGFALDWYSKLPDWAVPCDLAARTGWLSELAATLAAATTTEELADRLGNGHAHAGILVSVSRHAITVELAPTIGAPELVLALGWAGVVWRLDDGCDDVPYLLVDPAKERPPRIGRWTVEAHLATGFPAGSELAAPRFRYEVATADRVRYLQIAR